MSTGNNPHMYLPLEIWLRILTQLPVADVCALSQTCKDLYALCNNSLLWKKLVLRDFDCPRPSVFDEPLDRLGDAGPGAPSERDGGDGGDGSGTERRRAPLSALSLSTVLYSQRSHLLTARERLKWFRAHPPENVRFLLFSRNYILYYEERRERCKSKYAKWWAPLDESRDESQGRGLESGKGDADTPQPSGQESAAEENVDYGEVEFEDLGDHDNQQWQQTQMHQHHHHQPAAQSLPPTDTLPASRSILQPLLGLDSQLNFSAAPDVPPRPLHTLGPHALHQPPQVHRRRSVDSAGSGEYVAANSSRGSDGGSDGGSEGGSDSEEQEQQADEDEDSRSTTSVESGTEYTDALSAEASRERAVAGSLLDTSQMVALRLGEATASSDTGTDLSVSLSTQNTTSMEHSPLTIVSAGIEGNADSPPNPLAFEDDLAMSFKYCYYNRQLLEHQWEKAKVCIHINLQAVDARIIFLEFNNNNSELIMVSEHRSFRVWRLADMRCVYSMQFSGKASWSLAAVNDALVASVEAKAGVSKFIDIWDAHTGECLAHLSGHTQTVCSLEFVESGSVLCSSDETKQIRLWDLHTGREPQLLFVVSLGEAALPGSMAAPSAEASQATASDNQGGERQQHEGRRHVAWRSLKFFDNAIYAIDMFTLHRLSFASAADTQVMDIDIDAEEVDPSERFTVLSQTSRQPVARQMEHARIGPTASMRVPTCIFVATDRVYVGHADGDISVWPHGFPHNYMHCLNILSGHESSVLAMDGFGSTRLAAVFSDCKLSVWDAIHHRILLTLPLLSPMQMMFFASHASWLMPTHVRISENQVVAALSNGEVKVWQL